MKRKTVSVLIVGVIIGFGLSKWIHVREPRLARDSISSSQASGLQTPRQSAKAVTAHKNSPHRALAVQDPAQSAEWKTFLEAFGPDLQPLFTRGGRLVSIQSIQGKKGRGVKAAGMFHPENPQEAIARAKEILEASRGLLGLQSDWPLDRPIARGDERAAIVSFNEVHDGMRLAPYGEVSMHLGPQGELLRLDSEYVSGMKIVNDVKIGVDEAKVSALASIPDDGGFRHVSGGSRVIWLSAGAMPPEARNAFEYYVEGRQVIVDASTGKVIYQRDRRDF